MFKLIGNEPAIVIANKIWDEMEVGQRVELLSFRKVDNKFVELGELVKTYMEELYRNKGRNRRPMYSIGGVPAEKLFRYSRTIREDELKWEIWRIQ